MARQPIIMFALYIRYTVLVVGVLLERHYLLFFGYRFDPVCFCLGTSLGYVCCVWPPLQQTLNKKNYARRITEDRWGKALGGLGRIYSRLVTVVSPHAESTEY